MKLVIIIFVLNVLVQCETSCDVDDEITLLFWENEHFNPFYENVYINADLGYFLEYLRLRKKLKNAFDSKFPKLQCGLEEICSTKVSELNLNNNGSFYCSFCELYFMIEHKKEYVFTIDYLEVWVFFQRNLSIHSNELINKNTNLSIKTR